MRGVNKLSYRKYCPYLSNHCMYQCPMNFDTTADEQDHSYRIADDSYPENRYVEGTLPTVRQDSGPEPFVIDIEDAAEDNRFFRVALWTGQHLQLTIMSINVGEDIGLEMHPDVDQFIRIEEGRGLIQMGDSQNALNFQRRVTEDDAIIIPAGKWHNLINTGNRPLKLYSIYAPPEHPKGTVHKTKAEAEAAEAGRII